MSADGYGVCPVNSVSIIALTDAGIDNVSLELQLLTAHVLGCTREDIILNSPVLNAEQQKQLDALVARRANREPMSHLLGTREFYGRDFKVTRDVLDPRPDTETLIDAALKLLSPKTNHQSQITILDLGTGSGCIILTLLAEWPQAKGVAVELSAAALEVATANAHALGVADRVVFIHADMATLEGRFEEKFDLIVSNPPYIPSADIATLQPEVAKFEPKGALDGGKDGLDYYRILAKTTPELLAPWGLMLCEIGETQAAEVATIFDAAGLKLKSVHKDLAGRDRCLVFKYYEPENELKQSGGI